MSANSKRVAQRFELAHSVVAKASLGPDLKKIEALVRGDKFEEALEALDSFLNKKLNVRVFPRRDEAHVKTEWAHSLQPRDKDRYLEMVQSLLSVRERLMHETPERLQKDMLPIRLLEEAQREMPWVEGLSRGADDEFKHGSFNVILTDGAGDGLDEALSTLDAAADKVRRKFPQVLYGKVYVRRGVIKGERGSEVAGSYVASGDFLNLSLYATPSRDSLKTLIHEFGHRYQDRFLNSDDRNRFIELSTIGYVQKATYSLSDRKKFAKELLELFREHSNENYPEPSTILSPQTEQWNSIYPRDEWRKNVVPLLKKFRDDKDYSVEKQLEAALGMYQYGGALQMTLNEEVQPLYASPYGSTSWEENFAESFLAFVLGTPLPEPLQDFMQGLR